MAGRCETIPLARHEMSEADIEAVVAALRSGRLSQGTRTAEFESALAQFVGTEHAVAVSSGTAALHLMMDALDLQPGDEVITTPFSYVASTNCVLYVGARPVFVDINEETLNLDPRRLERALSPRTRAILPVHIFGRPCEMDAVMDFARSHKLVVVEDACEAVGARYHGRRVGSIGRTAGFGFYPNKQMTMAEGGAIVTHDGTLAELFRSLRNQGLPAADESLHHARLGYNYRPTELQCALGASQLRRLPQMLAQRAVVADWYREHLADVEEIVLPATAGSEVELSWFAFVVRFEDHFAPEVRDRMVRELAAQGIECANYFPAIHLLPHVRDRLGCRPGDCPVTERVAARTLALPFSSCLTREEVERVATALKASLAKVLRTEGSG